MNLYQAQRHAEDNGYDSEKFIAFFPAGTKVCKWIDAYFGMFNIEGTGDGFVMVRDVDDMCPNLVCEPITPGAD
jgi:hypothetical protein